MWPGRAPGRADVADRVPADHPLPRRHGDARQVGVPRLESQPVPDDDEVSVAAGVPAGERHASAACGTHAPAIGGRHVESGVGASADPSEPVGDRRTDRPEELDWVARSRVDLPMSQRAQRRRSRDAVDGQPHSALVATNGGVGVRPEAAVVSARAVSTAGEQELQGGDVPAALALAHRPAAEARPTAPPQRAACARSRDAVHLQASPALEGAHGATGQRSLDPVDRAPVQPERAHRNLEGGDVRAAGVSGRGQDEADPKNQGESGCAHGRSIGLCRVSLHFLPLAWPPVWGG